VFGVKPGGTYDNHYDLRG